MKTAVFVLALAMLTVVTAAEPASAGYAELTDGPPGFVGAGVYVSPPGAGAGVCCRVGAVGAACLRP